MLVLRIVSRSLATRDYMLRPDGCSLVHGGNGYGVEVYG